MKHLKSFNETSIIDIKENCELLLVELKDKGAKIHITSSRDSMYDAFFNLVIGVGLKMLCWGEVKLTLIPFMQMFVSYYGKISNIRIQGTFSTAAYLSSYDDFIEDKVNNLNNNIELMGISFSFKI